MTLSEQDAPALDVRGVHFRYGDRDILQDVSFSIKKGTCLGLLGPNGSGKSTLIRLFAGLLDPLSGSISAFGNASHSPSSRQNIGFVAQQPSLDPKLTTSQNLMLAARLYGMSWKQARHYTRQGLEWAGLSSRAHHAVTQLSGGLKRRLDLARALLHRPSLLLLDEPTSGLDEFSFRDTWERLKTAQSEHQLSIVVATHRPDEADHCDRLVVLNEGKTVAENTPDELKALFASDAIVVELQDTDSIEQLTERLSDRWSKALHVVGKRIIIECENGHRELPRLFEILPTELLKSVNLRRSSLADVFFKITGSMLDMPQQLSEERPN